MTSLKPFHSIKESGFHCNSDHCQVNTFLKLGSWHIKKKLSQAAVQVILDQLL